MNQNDAARVAARAASQPDLTEPRDLIIMTPPKRPVNDGDNATNRATEEQLTRLRALIRGKRHWIFATDDDIQATAVHILATLQILGGATAEHVVLFEVPIHIVDRGCTLHLRVAAFSKATLTPEAVAEFLRMLTHTPEETLAGLARGTDLIALADDPLTIGFCLERIVSGRVSLTNPNSN